MSQEKKKNIRKKKVNGTKKPVGKCDEKIKVPGTFMDLLQMAILKPPSKK